MEHCECRCALELYKVKFLLYCKNAGDCVKVSKVLSRHMPVKMCSDSTRNSQAGPQRIVSAIVGWEHGLQSWPGIFEGLSPGGTSGKEPAWHCRRHKRCRSDPWVRKIPCRRTWQPTPVFLPGKSHGQRSPKGYSQRGHKELDTTKTN